MYIFKGRNTETGEKFEKQFEDLSEAEELADSSNFSVFQVIDMETDETVYSDEQDRHIIDRTIEDIFPEGNDSMEGFDVDDFLGLND